MRGPRVDSWGCLGAVRCGAVGFCFCEFLTRGGGDAVTTSRFPLFWFKKALFSFENWVQQIFYYFSFLFTVMTPRNEVCILPGWLWPTARYSFSSFFFFLFYLVWRRLNPISVDDHRAHLLRWKVITRGGVLQRAPNRAARCAYVGRRNTWHAHTAREARLLLWLQGYDVRGFVRSLVGWSGALMCDKGREVCETDGDVGGCRFCPG